MAADDDLSDRGDGLRGELPAVDLERLRRQADDLSAIDAQKVRMLARFLSGFFPAKLEALHVVPEVEPGQRSLLRQFVQRPIDRRLIESELGKLRRDFCVAQRSRRIGDPL